jgi:hypothetical protein
VADLNAISRSDPKFGDDYPIPTPDAAEFFSEWVDDAAANDAGASFFCVENSYWNQRSNTNVLLVHYNDLKTIVPAKCAELPTSRSTYPIRSGEVTAAGFDAMKEQSAELIPAATGFGYFGLRVHEQRRTVGGRCSPPTT